MMHPSTGCMLPNRLPFATSYSLGGELNLAIAVPWKYLHKTL